MLSLYAEVLTITKFKICQCILMTDLPNLMLAKVPTVRYLDAFALLVQGTIKELESLKDHQDKEVINTVYKHFLISS